MAADASRHGAYLCIGGDPGAERSLAMLPIDALAERLGLRNEYLACEGHPDSAIAFLRRVDMRVGDLADPGLSNANAIVHIASGEPELVTEFCNELERLFGRVAPVRTLRGAVRPTQYTGGAMHDFAYARQLRQQSGEAMPNAFLLPLRKLPEWWAKDWMERHTYFLPRYASGRMTHEGHALAAAAGVESLVRRTYTSEPSADGGGYDFLTYFECTDGDVPTFHAVCAGLRDQARNPEWQFVREGPTWHGRRVTDYPSLFRRSSDTSPTTATR